MLFVFHRCPESDEAVRLLVVRKAKTKAEVSISCEYDSFDMGCRPPPVLGFTTFKNLWCQSTGTREPMITHQSLPV